MKPAFPTKLTTQPTRAATESPAFGKTEKSRPEILRAESPLYDTRSSRPREKEGEAEGGVRGSVFCWKR